MNVLGFWLFLFCFMIRLFSSRKRNDSPSLLHGLRPQLRCLGWLDLSIRLGTSFFSWCMLGLESPRWLLHSCQVPRLVWWISLYDEQLALLSLWPLWVARMSFHTFFFYIPRIRDAIIVPVCIHFYLSLTISFLIFFFFFKYFCSSATCKAKALKVWWLLVNPLAQRFSKCGF